MCVYDKRSKRKYLRGRGVGWYLQLKGGGGVLCASLSVSSHRDLNFA